MANIQNALQKAQTLCVWNDAANTRVTTDASDVGMGAILEQQVKEEEWNTVAA